MADWLQNGKVVSAGDPLGVDVTSRDRDGVMALAEDEIGVKEASLEPGRGLASGVDDVICWLDGGMFDDARDRWWSIGAG